MRSRHNFLGRGSRLDLFKPQLVIYFACVGDAEVDHRSRLLGWNFVAKVHDASFDGDLLSRCSGGRGSRLLISVTPAATGKGKYGNRAADDCAFQTWIPLF